MKPKTALTLVEWTSVPLLLVTGLMAVTGYASTSDGALKASLFLTRETAVEIHTSPLMRALLGVLLFLHAYAGTELMAARIKEKALRTGLEYGVLGFVIYVLWVLVVGSL
ncbi:hypothetical protein [Thermococcus sp.]|uniref:hypothetical protein n=1 Tax=Thermococcus sp. TaxID=35749 RepID=UPI0025EDF9AB|nr:hypothetical protein [Thermococcus sp.]